jgi:peptide/nickel transport system substrate-binding protein
VVVAVAADIAGVNPLLSGQSKFSTDIQDRLFLRLFEEKADFNQHPPTFAPRLVQSVTWSADRLTLDLRLRDDVQWSDGAPVTAADVVWTWHAQTDASIAWSYAQSKEAIDSMEALSPDEVRVHFSKAYAGQIADLNEGQILPKHAWSRLPFNQWRGGESWFRQHLVTDGPFLLSDWRPDEQLVLRANPTYYEKGLPRLDRVVFRIVPDRASQLVDLRAGSVDFVEQITPEDAASLEGNPEYQLWQFWARQYNYICWNTRNPLFQQASVRRALTMAIDRQALVDALWRGHARVGASPIIQSVWAADPQTSPWPYQPDVARRILAEQGWRDTDGDGILDRDGAPFRFELMTNTGTPVRRDAVVMIQDQLRRIGVDARPRLLEFNTVNDLTQRHQFDAFLGAWAIDTSLDLKYAFHSDSVQDGYNFGGYSNPQLDVLIDRARREVKPMNSRDDLYAIQRILHRDQPYTFLWEPQKLAAGSSRIRDARPNELSDFDNLRDWWMAPAR